MTKKQTRGDKLRAAVLETHEFSPVEMVLLEELCDVATILDEERDNLSYAEVRAQQIVLSRLAGQLNIDAAPAPPQRIDGPSVRGRRAATIRWERERQAKGA